MILTVLTNQFIKIVNVTQSCLVQLQAEGAFLLPVDFAVILLEVNTAKTKSGLRGERRDSVAAVPQGSAVQNPKHVSMGLYSLDQA